MKKKKLLLLMVLVLVLTACGNSDDDTDTGGEPSTEENGGEVGANSDAPFSEFGLDENLRFIEPRTISVGLWDRGNDRMPVFAESYWAVWIEEQMLAEHNIIIEWDAIPRWGEDEHQAATLAAQTAPDIGYTFSQSMVTTMAEMDGMLNLYPLLQQYRDLLPHLFATVTEENIFWNFDSTREELWSITGRRATEGIQGTATFIREDWLDILDLPVPTTLEEFEDALIAFRDHADILPGNINGQVTPYLITSDVGWTARGLLQSFIPNDVTEREWFVYGFDDRSFFWQDAMRDGLRVLNRWHDEGLLWNDFAIAADEDGFDLIRLGNVGATHHTWDQPFRPADEWLTGEQGMFENVGPDANFIAINPFQNDAGLAVKYMSPSIDRFVFFPRTNTEPLASLLYLDFMNRPDTLDFLQFGYEGIHHEVLDGGVIAMLAETVDHEVPDNMLFGGGRNFDLNPLINGVHFDLVDPDRAIETAALGYPGIEPDIVIDAIGLTIDNSRVFRNVTGTGVIEEEQTFGSGLVDQRDVIFHTLVGNTSPENFESTFETMYQNWLNMGATQIIEAREAAWIETFGDVDTMPE